MARKRASRAGERGERLGRRRKAKLGERAGRGVTGEREAVTTGSLREGAEAITCPPQKHQGPPSSLEGQLTGSNYSQLLSLL